MTANRLGIDFSQDYFDLVLANCDGQLIGPARRFVHDWPGSQQALAYVLDLSRQHPADELWIGGESTGLLWWHLFQHWAVDPELATQSPVFYLINPQPLKHFRAATPRTDKTDPNDARLIVRYLGLPDNLLSEWQPDADYWPLRFLTRYRCHLAHHLAVLKLRALSILYIQASAYSLVAPFHDPFGAASRKVLQNYPTLDSLAQTPLEALAQQLDAWSKHKFADPQDNARKLLEVVRRSYPISDDLAAHIHFILGSLLSLIDTQAIQLQRCDRFLTEHYADDLDIAHLDGIPGIGPVYATGLAAELRPTERFIQPEKYDLRHGGNRPRTFSEAQAAVGKLAGLWWPRIQSGDRDSEDRHMPRPANPYLRYYLVEAAYHVREHVDEYAQFYQRKYREARKHKHRRALVLTARKLARLVFALLHKQEAYQPRRPSAT